MKLAPSAISRKEQKKVEASVMIHNAPESQAFHDGVDEQHDRL